MINQNGMETEGKNMAKNSSVSIENCIYTDKDFKNV